LPGPRKVDGREDGDTDAASVRAEVRRSPWFERWLPDLLQFALPFVQLKPVAFYPATPRSRFRLAGHE